MSAPDALTHEKRQAILDAARNNFAAHGYEGASMAAITAGARVSKTTIYHQFHCKAELFGAVVGRECERMLVHFDTGEQAGPACDVLRAIGRAMIALLVSPTCLMIDRVVTAEAGAFPELAQAFWAAGPARGIAQLSGWLQARTVAGELCVPDPDFAAEQFFMLVQAGTVSRARLRLAHPAPEQIAGAVDSAVRVFLAFYAERGND